MRRRQAHACDAAKWRLATVSQTCVLLGNRCVVKARSCSPRQGVRHACLSRHLRALFTLQAEAARAEAQSMAEAREAAMAEMLVTNAALRVDLQAALMRQVPVTTSTVRAFRGVCWLGVTDVADVAGARSGCGRVRPDLLCRSTGGGMIENGPALAMNKFGRHRSSSLHRCTRLERHDKMFMNGCAAQSYPL